VAIQAVIFDMDGVIVDSEPYSVQALIDILRQYGVEPTACVAIEDAPAGVEAAKRAGMRCIAVTNSVAREQLQEADLIVASLADDLSPVLPL
jgi:beta-phosphoglucomutase-like phosphatase (HAD superfamily)